MPSRFALSASRASIPMIALRAVALRTAARRVACSVDLADIWRSSADDTVASMTIVARRGRIIAEPRRRPHGFDRVAPPDARSETGRDLARIALDVVVRAVDPATLPRRWSTSAFAREVALVRDQLAPIHSRRSLAESFGREAAVAATTTPATIVPPQAPGPVRVAYAIRWLELGDERSRPGWDAWIGLSAGVAPDQRNGEITT
jgi:hypothetical protein